jgi:hypothetical protein
VTGFKQYIAGQDRARRASRTAHRHVREDAGDVSVMRSFGFDAASVALPANVDLELRAARMNEFWSKLVEFQDRDVLVVALAVGDER